MLRKLVLLLVVVLALLGGALAASAGPIDGCYAAASAASVKEDETFTVTVQCENIPILNNVFGFQIGTTRSGDYDAAVLPTTYTAGQFSDAGYGATSGVVVGQNSLSGLYAVTRMNNEVVNNEDFTLGSYVVTADDDLTLDGSVTITFTDGDFMLSNDVGQSLSGWLRDVNDVTVTITDIDLAWLSGDMVVRSDVTTISNLAAIDLVIGSNTYSATNIASYTNTFVMDDTFQYSEAGTPASDGTLSVNVTADMSGHLACSTSSINLGDTGAATNVDTKVGTSGTITLKAGDADDDNAIDIDDATLIGANIGTAPSGERDINGDGAINILDLVHVGRNYNNLTVTSCGTGS